MKKILLLSVFAFAVSACNNQSESNNQERKLIEDVMAVHDQVMPKGDEVMALKSTLDSIAKVSPDSVTALKIISELDSADNKMSDWMAAYNPDLVKGKSHEEVIKYFEGEKAKITEVKNLTNSSIEKAKKFLSK